MIFEQQVAGRVDVHPVRDDGVDRDPVRGNEPDHAAHGEDAERQPPPAGRDLAVREEQDRQDQQGNPRRPGRLEQDRELAEGQAPVMVAVVEDRVGRRRVVEGEAQRQAEEDPPHRVPRLAPRHDETDDPEAGDEDDRAAVAGAQAVVGHRERDRRQREQDHSDAEGKSRPRRRQSPRHGRESIPVPSRDRYGA